VPIAVWAQIPAVVEVPSALKVSLKKRKALLTLPFINAVPGATFGVHLNPSVQARNRISGDAIMGAPNSVETALRKDPVSFRAPVRTPTLLSRIR